VEIPGVVVFGEDTDLTIEPFAAEVAEPAWEVCRFSWVLENIGVELLRFIHYIYIV
jgi:hypothetical protein